MGVPRQAALPSVRDVATEFSAPKSTENCLTAPRILGDNPGSMQ
jgi:hypothetical protein